MARFIFYLIACFFFIFAGTFGPSNERFNNAGKTDRHLTAVPMNKTALGTSSQRDGGRRAQVYVSKGGCQETALAVNERLKLSDTGRNAARTPRSWAFRSSKWSLLPTPPPLVRADFANSRIPGHRHIWRAGPKEVRIMTRKKKEKKKIFTPPCLSLRHPPSLSLAGDLTHESGRATFNSRKLPAGRSWK